MKVLGFVVGFIALFGVALALDSAAVWLAVKGVAGHDLSFREIVGGGLLLLLVSSDVTTKNR